MFFGNNFQTLEIVPPALRCGGIYFAGALIEPRVGRTLRRQRASPGKVRPTRFAVRRACA